MPTRFKKLLSKQKKRYSSFMDRRPHRTLRLTRRRDYIRPLELPGNIAFTCEVTALLWVHKKTFVLLAIVSSLLYAVLVGIQSQNDYASLGNALKAAGGDLLSGGWGAVGQASVLLVSQLTSSFGSQATEAQQIFSAFIFLLTWLTTVWLLRNIMAGHKVKLRDGLYNSSAPLLPTLLIAFLIAVQLLPVLIAVIGYSAALSTGVLSGGVATMLFWLAAGLLGILSLYWVTSSLFAMVIITLPGMYPSRAIKTAGDIMVGRRLKMLFRWLWMAGVITIASLLVLIPIVLLDMWLKNVWPAMAWMPLVPVVLVVWSAIVAIWCASYVYLLYRKVVDYVPR